jgi:hypothetical protein
MLSKKLNRFTTFRNSSETTFPPIRTTSPTTYHDVLARKIVLLVDLTREPEEGLVALLRISAEKRFESSARKDCRYKMIGLQSRNATILTTRKLHSIAPIFNDMLD